MELRMYCAYNQTRECFLGLEVTAGDFSYKALSREGALTIKPNEGLWLTPFRGIPDSGVTAPLDLIFLDIDCRVVDLVESFPAIRTISSMPGIETLLVLPAHSIFSSETQLGDQFVLCVAEEMQRRLERLSGKGTDAAVTPRTALCMAKPLGNDVSGITAVEERSDAGDRRSEPAHEKPMPNPPKSRFTSPLNWLKKKTLSTDHRAPRHPAKGLAAYYWNGHGVPPTGHNIRDISSSGLYVLTEDRWYPGTLILMSLQPNDGSEVSPENVIAVNARAVRWGDDGVGLQFVLRNTKASEEDPIIKDIDQKALEHFLQRLKVSNE